MTNTRDTELLILALSEIPDHAWSRELAAAKRFFQERLTSYPQGALIGNVSTRNIGRGADWTVIAVSITSAVATAFFAIPKAHKLVRESIEEWRRIYRELRAIYEWVCAERSALYPDAYLFLLALTQLEKTANSTDLAFTGVMRLPESNPDLAGMEALLFSFTAGDVVEQIAVSRTGDVLWRNSFLTNDPTNSTAPPSRDGM